MDDTDREIRIEGGAAEELRLLGTDGVKRLLDAVRRLRLAGADPVAHLIVAGDAEECFRKRGKARLRDLLSDPKTLHVLFAPSVLETLHLLRTASAVPSPFNPDDKSLRALSDAIALRRTEGGKRGRPPKTAQAAAASGLDAMVDALATAVRMSADGTPAHQIDAFLRDQLPVLLAARGRRLGRDIDAIAAGVSDMDGRPTDAKRRRLVKAYLTTALDLKKPAWKADSALLRRRKP